MFFKMSIIKIKGQRKSKTNLLKVGDLTVRLSDIIEEFIKDMLSTSEGVVEFQRNEIANKFNCVPSQINYVIDTRFTVERGYYVESRRGGGGCIVIKSVRIDKDDYLMHIINNIGNAFSQQLAHVFINNFVDYGIINIREAKLMRAATNDKVLPFSPVGKDYQRANILKNMLITLL